MEPKAQSAERLLRGLGVAVKTFALYPLPHPVTVRAVDTLLVSLRRYTDAHGPFSARVTKRAFSVDGIPFRSGAHANLALYFFTRKIAHFKVLPAVSEQALTQFVAALGMDRAGLDAAGGVRHLLRQAGVGNIQVTEMVLEQDTEEQESLDLSGIFEMLGRGRASPQEREQVVEILQGGTDQARVLLDNIIAMASGASAGAPGSEITEQVDEAMGNLDRLVLDEPFEDQPRLYASLAGATLAMRAPLRSTLMQTLVRRSSGIGLLRRLGGQLSAEQLASLVGESLAADGNTTQQVTTFLRALCQDREKARAALVILDTKLQPAGQQPNWLAGPAWEQLQPPPQQETRIPAEFTLGNGAAAPAGPGLELTAESARTIDEPSTIREAARTLVDVLRQERDERDRKEINDIADALTGYLSWLADQREYSLLGDIFQKIADTVAQEGGMRRTSADEVLRHIAESAVLDELLSALWDARGTVAEREIRRCLEALRGYLVHPLVHSLGNEQRAGARAMLCDLMIDLYRDRVDDLAAFVTDQRWYVVRNIADILGRMRSPQAVAYLSRLVTHPDYRVRRESLNALASIGTGDAQAILTDFVDDPDERLRLRAIQSLNSLEAWRAMPKLLAILGRRDPFNRQFELKQAILEALARLGAKQSLPVVKRLAGAWFVWGARGRELRRIASMTAAIIAGPPPLSARGPRAPDERGAR